MVLSCTIFLFLLLLRFSLVNGTVIHVNSYSGSDSECLSPDPDSPPCCSIEFVAKAYQGQSNLTIYIDTDIPLKGVIAFDGVFNISIIGSTEHEKYKLKTVDCSGKSQTGFSVHDVDNIAISNLKLNRCGAVESNSDYEAAIVFVRSSNIHLKFTTVRKARLTGLVFLDCYQNVILEKVYLYSNGYGHGCSSNPAGVSIEMTNSSATANYTLTDCNLRITKTLRLNRVTLIHLHKASSTGVERELVVGLAYS